MAQREATADPNGGSVNSALKLNLSP